MAPTPVVQRVWSVLRAPGRLGFREVVIIAMLLVVYRSAVWVIDESAHFNSDQAITGLMAKHLAEGRAFPLYFYGQRYLLGVEAWLAAPVFWVTGATVTGLKLPLLALNLVIAWVLLRILVRDQGLPPVHALILATFFILPPVAVSNRLVEAQGGNIEPLLYILLLWMLRDRPIAGGLLVGFAIFHREFTAYAVLAILVVDALSGRAFTQSRLRDYFVAFGSMNVTWNVLRLLRRYADLSGPGTAGTLTGAEDLRRAESFLCWNPGEIGANLQWLIAENLGTLFGWKRWPHDLGNQTLVTGGVWMAFLLACALVAALVVLVQKRSSVRQGAGWMFPCYLIAVAVQAALTYAVFSCIVRDVELVRYTLLTLFLPIGLFALALSLDPAQRWRRAMLTLVATWALWTFADQARFVVGWTRHTPLQSHRDLANLLEAEGVKHAWAPYLDRIPPGFPDTGTCDRCDLFGGRANRRVSGRRPSPRRAVSADFRRFIVPA